MFYGLYQRGFGTSIEYHRRIIKNFYNENQLFYLAGSTDYTPYHLGEPPYFLITPAYNPTANFRFEYNKGLSELKHHEEINSVLGIHSGLSYALINKEKDRWHFAGGFRLGLVKSRVSVQYTRGEIYDPAISNDTLTIFVVSPLETSNINWGYSLSTSYKRIWVSGFLVGISISYGEMYNRPISIIESKIFVGYEF